MGRGVGLGRTAVRVLIVTGIFPPDIGGPATHTRDLADALRARGHRVHVLSLTDDAEPQHQAELTRWPRRWSWARRGLALARWMRAHRHEFDVVYANSMTALAVRAARAAGLPVVAKVVGDHAWERGVRLGLTAASFDDFQTGRPRGRLRLMQWARNSALRQASAVTAPSEMMRPLVEQWAGARPVTVVPNGVAVPDELPPVDRPDGKAAFVFVGRLVGHKRVDLILRAVAATGDVALDVIGSGPELEALETLTGQLGVGHRVRFCGPLPHDEVLARMQQADALVLASEYEMLPHAVIEALAMGTPVIAPPVGGTAETSAGGGGTVLLEPCTAEAMAEAMAAVRDDAAYRDRLREAAALAGASWTFERCASAVETVLARAAGTPPGAPADTPEATPGGFAAERPRAVFMGRSRVALDDPAFCRKLGFIAAVFDATVIGTGSPRGHRRVAGVRTIAFAPTRGAAPGWLWFHLAAPLTALFRTAGRTPGVIVVQGPHGAVAPIAARQLLPRRWRPAVVVETHGDWHASARLYGGRVRHALAGAADRAAAYALRHADRVRVVSSALEAQVRAVTPTVPIVRYTTFGDFARFRDAPLVTPPSTPVAVFAGGLDPVKGVDVLIDAWVSVLDRLPAARLVIAGDGPARGELEARVQAAGVAHSVEFAGRIDREALRVRLDAANCLVLPSRSEGLPRVILEAMARARPVVATAVGGIPELVDDPRTGRLVPPDDAPALAGALVAVLGDPHHAAQAGAQARADALARDPEQEFEAGTAALGAWLRNRRP